MSATRKQQDAKQSERLLEISWREDNQDSTRNPIVEASNAVTSDDVIGSEIDEELYNSQRLESVVDSFISDEREQVILNDFVKLPTTQAVQPTVVEDSNWVAEDAPATMTAEAAWEDANAALEAQVDNAFSEPTLVTDAQSNAASTIEAIAENTPETASVTIRIDEVMQHIAPYRAVVDNKIGETTLLGRSLLAQANAIFNTAFLNLQSRYDFADVYAAAPGSTIVDTDDSWDVTNTAIREVMRLQRLV